MVLEMSVPLSDLMAILDYTFVKINETGEKGSKNTSLVISCQKWGPKVFNSSKWHQMPLLLLFSPSSL